MTMEIFVSTNDNWRSFLFHRSRGITDGQTLGEVLPEEGPDPAKALILRGVDQFVSDQSTLAPAVAPARKSRNAERGRGWPE